MVTGEAIDTFCFAPMGAKGMSQKQFAIDCAKKGIPVAVLQKGTRKVSGTTRPMSYGPSSTPRLLRIVASLSRRHSLSA